MHFWKEASGVAATMRVLLIDPDEGFRRAAMSLMLDIPFVVGVALAASAEQARSLLMVISRPDVVLLTLAPSAGSGAPRIRRIRQSPGRPQVVAMTVFNEPEYVDGCRSAGAHDWLPKSDFADAIGPCLSRLLPGEEAGNRAGMLPHREVSCEAQRSSGRRPGAGSDPRAA